MDDIKELVEVRREDEQGSMLEENNNSTGTANLLKSSRFDSEPEVGSEIIDSSYGDMDKNSSWSSDSMEDNTKVPDSTSHPFLGNMETFRSFRQGDGLAPLLFNIALHIAIIKSEVQINGTIFNKTQQVLGYTDDVIIFGRRIQDVEEALIALDKETQKLGFKINTKKSKFMSVTKRQNDQVKEVKMGTYKFEKVKEFTYLGSILTANNDLRNEVQRRINLANRAYYSLLPIVKNKIISREIKIKIYKTLIRPIITYGTETWVLNKNTCKQLAVFERKILRRIFGAIETVDGWRARYNNEIYELYKESDLEVHIRCQRLRWLGHVTRMETTRKVKIVFNNNPDGTRLRGRPRTRWWNCVRVDVNRLE
ncbi:hypothetical protein ANN_01884 [Periplaneta americana]|uniref:Reverse transcriptase domain-containing protein n=1 Tax=Periplaneta americana TaxID=6978 RepID=A0ABQ8TUU1_PERAM|nr:hypothetical protein ANN_01884 [Periplaneta americana]